MPQSTDEIDRTQKILQNLLRMKVMDQKSTVATICLAIAVICALVMYPLSAQLISLPRDELTGDAYKTKWLLDCVLGVIGLVSAITGKRLSDRKKID